MERQPVLVEGLEPGQEHHIEAVFDAMSPDSRYLRFHAPVPRLSARIRSALAEVRPGRRHGALAFVDGRAVGLGQWVRYDDRPDVADVSLAVADAYQRRGIGGALLAHLVQDAATHGIAELSCWVHPDNRAVHRMLARWPTRPGPAGRHEWLVALPVLLRTGARPCGARAHASDAA